MAVIIPTLNAAANLANCLASIESLSCPHREMDLIVVDGGSSDATIEIARNFGARTLVRRGTSRGGACNEGVRASTASIVAFTDSDAVVPRDWLNKIVTEMETDTLDAVGGIDLGLGELSSIGQAVSAMDLFRRKKETYGWMAVFKIKGVNSAYKRVSFLAVGGFDDSLTFGEESELHARMVDRGKIVKFSPNMIVYHRRDVQELGGLVRSFWVSRRSAPLLFRPWVINAALRDFSSPVAMLLMLFLAVVLGVPILGMQLVQGNILPSLGVVIALVIGGSVSYSLIVIRKMKESASIGLFTTLMGVLPIQAFLRAIGVTIGVLELLVGFASNLIGFKKSWRR